MKKKLDITNRILVLLFFLFPFIPSFMVVDRMAVGYLYFSIVCVVIFISLVYQKLYLSLDFLKTRPLIILYFIFLIWQLLTLINAFNIIEGLIEFFQYLTIFISICFIALLAPKYNNISLFFIPVVVLGTIETVYSFSIFLENYSFENGIGRLRELQGFASNQLFNSYAILIKIPILFYLIFNQKNKYIRLLLWTLFSLMLFMLLVLASRSSIYCFGLLIVVLILILLFQNKVFDKKIISKKDFLTVILISVLTSGVQTYMYQNSDTFSVLNRATNLNDDSTSYRLDNYKEAIQGIIDYPLLGVGIGNWKILSLKYSSSRLKSYQVPKHTHNDFLQIGAETGILGLLIFISIFISIIICITKELKNRDDKLLPIILFLCLIVYLTDSFFNFPRIRPYSQMNFFVITFMYSWMISQTTKNK